jgi:hypothetical protein
MTYYSAAAIIPGGRHYYVEDPNGDWIDPSTGKRYGERDMPGAAGVGFTQIDVVALEGSAAVLEVTSYGIVDARNRVAIRTVSGLVGFPGAGADWWLNPQVLGRYPDRNTPELRVLRMPYTVSGRTFNAIRFQSVGSSFMAWNYDLETGVLLHTGTSSTGPPITGPMPAGESREGGTLITHSTVMSVRTPHIPWASLPAPAWVGQTRVLRYEGQVTLNVPGAGTFGPAQMSITFERQSGSGNWARYLQTAATQLGSQQTFRVAGPAQVGGLWVHPSVLGQLQSGQVLDTDPITGEVVSVGQIGRTPQGHDVVGIRRTASGFRIDGYYSRRDGVLLYIVQDAPTVYMHYQATLVSRQ